VDDGVEHGDAGPRAVRLVQRTHVARAKDDVGVQRRGLGQHPRRQIDADDRQPAVGQIATDLTRPTAHVADNAQAQQPGREPVEYGPIQRLTVQFMVDLPRVFAGDTVVAVLRL